MLLFVNRISEILKDVGQQKNVRKKVVIVIILHRFHVILCPNFTSPIIVFLRARFVFQGIIKCLDWREFHLREYLRSGHE